MVQLVSPSETENFYLIWLETFIGPFSTTGSHNSVKAELPSIFDKFEESRGIWHENNVLHSKLTGEFLYHPLAMSTIPAPTTVCPDQIQQKVFKYTNAEFIITAPLGKFQDGRIACKYDSGVTMKTLSLQEYDPVTGDISIWDVTVQKSAPTRVYSAFIYRLKSVIQRTTTDGCTLKRTSQQYGGTFKAQAFNLWSDVITPDQLKAAVLSSSNHYAEGAVTSSSMSWYRGSLNPSYLQKYVTSQLYALIATFTLGDVFFPIEDKNYGDLAMKASEKVVANQVNMIAFLRDLRHPTEMIPKLKNLSNLKTWAGNYLSFKYGVLPTVDDISSIMESFKRIAPYVDRNKFSTYSAGFTDSLTIGTSTYQLEQHVKLAISDEDDELDALLQRIESSGFAPTLQNIWDLVPYSFVIDWLIDVGGFLERVDTRLRLTRLNIRYTTMSRKRTHERKIFLSQNSPFTGSVKWVQYHRWVVDHCPVPPLSLNPTFQDFSHWLESSALLMQRVK